MPLFRAHAPMPLNIWDRSKKRVVAVVYDRKTARIVRAALEAATKIDLDPPRYKIVTQVPD